jgi:crotonobetainyl-CoA:carnitine CoA-transferase CaiB-like acyl-CoA transferase
MFDHPQVRAQGIIDTFVHPVVGRYRGVAQSIRFGRTPGPAPFAAPVLGQDTAAVIAAIEAGSPIAPKPRGNDKD